MTTNMKEIIDNSCNKFKYQMLDRMLMDIRYYLGYGNRNENNLWSGSVEAHIEDTKALYNSFKDDEKPEWCTIKLIEDYEKDMKTA